MGIFSALIDRQKEKFIEKARDTNKRKSGEINARLFFDAKKNKILFIPSEINHPEFIAAYIGKTKEDIKKDVDLIEKFVPVTVEISEGKATGILIGISGLETWLQSNRGKYNITKKLFHKKKYVNEAKDFILAMLQEYEMLTPNFTLKVIYR